MWVWSKELGRMRRVLSAEADGTLQYLHKSSNITKAPHFQPWPMLAGSEELTMGFEPIKTWQIFWMNYDNTGKLPTTEPYGSQKKNDNHLSELCSCLFLFHSSMCNKVVEDFTCKTQHRGHVRVNSDKQHGLKKGHRTAEMATNDTKMGLNCDKDRERCKYNSKILIVTGPP